ncbi:probable Sterol 3-beta-glucosyltransferase [Rhynchosporium agropyri]|uniref:Sterol 3-beta-glucosyltransferase n=1 Tax=Rhynchosporium agropyri TaxID=914238 RepID=A0A1E1KIX1_9HELO|nr:probable Sterol 3-beta-glucosyltransferase [Rhynchosporium agropyri]
MAPEEDIKKRVVRKLTKTRKEGRLVTMDIPERFRDGDDADEDCTALSGRNAYMNQSVFGMIAAAGSQVDFNARFDGPSSDEEEDSGDPPASLTTELKVDKTREGKLPAKPEKNHRRKFSESKLLRSLSGLGRSKSKLSSSGSGLPSPTPSSEAVTPDTQAARTISRDAPVMSRMLEARAELSLRPSFDTKRPGHIREGAIAEEQTSSSLAMQLMDIFDFEAAEDVIEEYPCWLLKSVLLQGYMYITTRHICFYAYLPKKSNEVVKSGYLSKSGRRNPKYNRYWFRLKDDVLAYYSDPSDLYFPSGNIDLRYGISANVVEKEKGKDATHFTVVTHQRKYHFKADSVPSAKEWVKSLQKIIFRSHNEGDSVKISLPIENIIDIEDSQIIDFADTCKIRVIDNDETYAIDEVSLCTHNYKSLSHQAQYFFSFFSFGKEALKVLRILVEDTTAQQIPDDVLVSPTHLEGARSPRSRSSGPSKRNSSQMPRERKPHPPLPPPIRTTTPFLEHSVRATLSPIGGALSPRASTENSRASSEAFRKSTDLKNFGRRSVDLGRLTMDGATGRRSVSASRRSLSRHRLPERRASEKPGSSDSFVHSLEEPGSSGALPSSSDDTQASASQILRGSDVFLSPTIQRSASTSRGHDAKSSNEDPRAESPSKVTSNAATMRPPKPRHNATTGAAKEQDAGQVEPSTAAPTLQSLVKAGAYPLQRAAGFAGYLNRHSKRMSTLLATESMGYVEKVSGMWKGGKKHYDEPQGLSLDDETYDDDEDQTAAYGDRFREHFALPLTEKLQASYFGFLHRVLPLYGKIYISDRSFCFRSLLPGTRTKLILPLKDIENVDKEKGFRFGYSGLVVVIRGHEELFFEFPQGDTRDDCAVTLLQNLETMRFLKESGLLSAEEEESAQTASAEHKNLQQARMDGFAEHEIKMPKTAEEARADGPPILFDDPRASILNFKPTESLRVTCLTIGSRGDVQPYIALCKGLMAEGHRPRIATHREFRPWIESHGIEFRPVEGDPAELMRICVENGMFTYSFLKEASTHFRGWIDELLSSGWIACQDSDLLIESPSAMCGIHIAEALGIPYFRGFSMPWTRTRAYPHAFAVPDHKMGGAYNYITYVMFDNVFWKAISSQVNRWRRKELGLQATSLERMQPNKVPFLYNFSPSVVVPPLDYSDWIRVTGYWFLDEGGEDWTAPKELTDFIKKARVDGKKIVYVGFGSIVVQDSAAMTETIVQSVLKADVRCILSRGWSDRLDKKDATVVEKPLPADILLIKSAPHDWLFKQIDAAAHHGGSGTTGASLRAGLPTIIKPFFGDQYFFGSRVQDLGVGICLKKLNVSTFSRAMWEACNSQRMIVKAKVLGETIRQENGVDMAIQSIYRDLDYAKSLIKRRDGKSTDDTVEDPEESWTFIGDEHDPALVKRIHDWDSLAQSGIFAQNAGSGGQNSESSDGKVFGERSESFAKDMAA